MPPVEAALYKVTAKEKSKEHSRTGHRTNLPGKHVYNKKPLTWLAPNYLYNYIPSTTNIPYKSIAS